MKNVKSVSEIEERVKQQFKDERVKVSFSSISLRADRVYVSREQAQRSIAVLTNLLEDRKQG